MKTIKSKLAALFMICCFVLLTGYTVNAADNHVPTASDNLNIGLRSTSELAATNNGYMRVFYNGKKICIEYYDDNFNIKSKKSLDMELSIWGGFTLVLMPTI